MATSHQTGSDLTSAGRWGWHTARPLLAAMALVLSAVAPVEAEDASDGCIQAVSETVYVPAFARIHTHERIRQPLASTLVIHNVDREVSITVTSVAFYDGAGSLVQTFLEDPVTLAPFASTNFLTELSDSRGGIGANYLLEWKADRAACSPLALAVMIGGGGTQGISFALEGRVIAREVSATK